MKYMSTNLGMPRVGRKRELKFATEKYWRQQISASELLSSATDVVEDIYNQQVTAGINLIPVNDFSFYDRVLDLCCLLGMTPKRFQKNEIGRPIPSQVRQEKYAILPALPKNKEENIRNVVSHTHW